MDVRVWYGARLCLLCVGASLLAALRARALVRFSKMRGFHMTSGGVCIPGIGDV